MTTSVPGASRQIFPTAGRTTWPSSATRSRRAYDYRDLFTGQPIFRARTESMGAISAEEAIALSATGPILRSTGVH